MREEWVNFLKYKAYSKNLRYTGDQMVREIKENVVTHVDYRGSGYASECWNFAGEIAKKENCYKMMLLTGSKDESTLNFYKNAGYNCADKTAFIQWIK